MNQHLSEIVVLLDRSGSMASIASDMVGGFDAFVREQRQVPGDCVLTLVQFDDQSIDTVHEAKPIGQVPGLVLQPRGMTPLLDAIGQTVRSVGARLAALPEHARPGRVFFVIITDGEENHSREFSRAQIRTIIAEQTTKWKWNFVYLGANVDAFTEADDLGILRSATAGFAPDMHGARTMYSNLSGNIRHARVTGQAVVYSNAQRADQGGDVDPQAPPATGSTTTSKK